MTTIAAKAKRVGGSIMVTLPKPVVDLLGITEGDILELSIRLPQEDLFGALRGIGEFTEEDRAEHG